MLVLSRKVGERIYVGDDVRITFISYNGVKARIGIEAPRGTPIWREELVKEVPAAFLKGDAAPAAGTSPG